MIGMDRRTGQPLAGVPYLIQRIEDALGTPLGTRRHRPLYGSQLRRMVDLPVNEGWKGAVQAEVARCLGVCVPEFKMSSARVTAVVGGKITLVLAGDWSGDPRTVEVTV